MTRLVAAVFLIMLGIILYQGWEVKCLNKEVASGDSYKSLYHASVKENVIWRDSSGKWRNKAEVAEASNKTLKEEVNRGNAEIANLRKSFPSIKKNFKNLDSYSNIQTVTTSEFTVPVREDTLFNSDSTKVPIKIIEYSNEFNDYTITIQGDSANVKRIGREEYEAAIYWQRLNKNGNKTFWPFGRKVYTEEMVSKNPETKIVKLSVLKVKRK